MEFVSTSDTDQRHPLIRRDFPTEHSGLTRTTAGNWSYLARINGPEQLAKAAEFVMTAGHLLPGVRPTRRSSAYVGFPPGTKEVGFRVGAFENMFTPELTFPTQGRKKHGGEGLTFPVLSRH